MSGAAGAELSADDVAAEEAGAGDGVEEGDEVEEAVFEGEIEGWGDEGVGDALEGGSPRVRRAGGAVLFGAFDRPGLDADAVGPGVPVGDHGFARRSGWAVARSSSSVRSFVHVVELPLGGLVAAVGGDDFVAAVAEGEVAVVFEAEGGGASDGFAGEGGEEAEAFHGLDVGVGVAFWVVGLGGLDEGGHEVDEVGRGRGRLVAAFGRDAGGPVDDEGGADAAFEAVVFVAAEGGVGGVGPFEP